METLIVHPDNKQQLVALKAFMKALKISFEEKESNYDPNLWFKSKKAENKSKMDKQGLLILLICDCQITKRLILILIFKRTLLSYSFLTQTLHPLNICYENQSSYFVFLQ